jgi:hypothetical protein
LSFRWLDRAADLLADGFLEDLLRVPVRRLCDSLMETSPARWTLLNVELWGRLHCFRDTPASLFEKIA